MQNKKAKPITGISLPRPPQINKMKAWRGTKGLSTEDQGPRTKGEKEVPGTDRQRQKLTLLRLSMPKYICIFFFLFFPPPPPPSVACRRWRKNRRRNGYGDIGPEDEAAKAARRRSPAKTLCQIGQEI